MRFFRKALATLALAIFIPGAFAAGSWQLSGFIYRAGIPMGLPSSGTFGTNGALTVTTAFPTTYANAYLYFPAGAICAGSAAGLYYTQMSSATAGTVFNNTYTSGVPTVPASPTTFTCAVGPGAYTQTLTVQPLTTIALTGGFLTANGELEIYQTWDYNGSANVKVLSTTLGGVTLFTINQTTTVHYTSRILMSNRGVLTAQVVDSGSVGGNGSTATFVSVNTGSTQNLTENGDLAAGTDWIMLESSIVEAYP